MADMRLDHNVRSMNTYKDVSIKSSSTGRFFSINVDMVDDISNLDGRPDYEDIKSYFDIEDYVNEVRLNSKITSYAP